MRALRQPAQDVFGADDGEAEGFQRAVERGDEDQPAGLEQPGAGRDEGGGIGDMLDDLHVEDDVEGLAVRQQASAVVAR